MIPMDRDAIIELWPFIALGGAGGAIKSINDDTFSFRELIIRVITGAFCAVLMGLYLKTTTYPLEMQFAFAGAVGVAGGDLIKALIKRMTKEITGENFEVKDVDLDCGDPADDRPVADVSETQEHGDTERADAEGDR